MADDDDPKAGELVTANYGWTKPTVGASDDQWGGLLNADLDGIDSVVHGIDTRPAYVLPVASTTVLGGAKVDGTTIHAAPDGTLSGTPSSGPPVTISVTAPASPQVGALWWDSVGGQLYTFYNDGNSSQWVIAVNAGASLQPASTTVLGGVKVDGTTIKAAADGTISAPIFMGDNRIINGDMRIDQRNAGGGVTPTATVYTVDRWQFAVSQASKFNVGQNLGPPGSFAPAFPYCLGFSSTSAYTPLAGDYFQVGQAIEADMVSDFQWGTANAQPVTLSFWAIAGNSVGTFSGSICNYAGTRSYPFTYSIPTANTWVKITLTIPGDTAGTWVMKGNVGAMYLRFDLGCGAANRGPANAWATANYTGVTGAVSTVVTSGAYFYVTGVKLEIGSVATPFNRQSLAKSMADCQRYYQAFTGLQVINYATGAGAIATTQLMWPPMRAAPTAGLSGQSYGNSSSLGLSIVGPTNSQTIVTAAGLGNVFCSFNLTLSAEL